MATKRPSRLGAAWTAGRLASRRLLGRAVGPRDLALGETLTSQLDTMKGLAMKVGQIVSYLDVPLPDAVQQQLAQLQTGKVGLPPEQIRAVIESALGAPVDELFDELDWTPVAAASIGQVHRAKVDGAPVAVKVQYPGVAQTFSDDLDLARQFSSLASLATAVDGRALVDELRNRLLEECDYLAEGRAQRAFNRAFAGDERVRIPAVLRHRSAATVLTSAWVDGDNFASLQGAPPSENHRRDAIAATLVRFSYRSLLGLGTIQADPHPGNFLFPGAGEGPLGTVAFLDFGCVRRLDVAMVGALREVVHALAHDDRARFRDAVQALGVVGRPRRFDYDYFWRVMEHLHRPLLAEHFVISPEYVREGYALNGPDNPNARTMTMPPAYIWVARLQWGLWSILARLRASGSFRGILDAILGDPIAVLPDTSAVGVAAVNASP